MADDIENRWVVLNISVRPELRQKLKVSAAEANLSIRAYVRKAIINQIKWDDRQKQKGGINAL